MMVYGEMCNEGLTCDAVPMPEETIQSMVGEIVRIAEDILESQKRINNFIYGYMIESANKEEKADCMEDALKVARRLLLESIQRQIELREKMGM